MQHTQDDVEPSPAKDIVDPTQSHFEEAFVEPEDRLQAQESDHDDSSSERVSTADKIASPDQEDNIEISPEISPKTIPSTKKRGDSAITLLTGIDPRNIITSSTDEGDQSHAPSTRRASRNLRVRKMKQSKLTYDQKYHPMDDSIRPSQAAKRRSIHGEEEIPLDDSSNSYAEYADGDTDSTLDSGNEHGTASIPVRKGKKRTRSEVDLCQPTRRSSRKTSNPKVSYSMEIHPQDKDLEELSDESDAAETSVNKRRKREHGGSGESMDFVDQVELGFDAENTVEGSSKRDSVLQNPSSPSSVATAPPSMIRRMESLEIWKQPLGHRHFLHERDSQVIVPGQYFEIFTEPFEEQLEREANACSPFNFDHDDKENVVDSSDVEVTLNPLEGISVIPASQHRRTSEDNYVSRQITVLGNAMYDESRDYSCPYGIGGSDGAQDDDIPTANGSPKVECMRTLVPGDQVPHDPTRGRDEEHVDGCDSVFGSSSSATVDVDSVITASSSFVESM